MTSTKTSTSTYTSETALVSQSTSSTVVCKTVPIVTPVTSISTCTKTTVVPYTTPCTGKSPNKNFCSTVDESNSQKRALGSPRSRRLTRALAPRPRPPHRTSPLRASPALLAQRASLLLPRALTPLPPSARARSVLPLRASVPLRNKRTVQARDCMYGDFSCVGAVQTRGTCLRSAALLKRMYHVLVNIAIVACTVVLVM